MRIAVMAALMDNQGFGGADAPGEIGPERTPRRGAYTTRIVRYGAMSWVGEFTYRLPAPLSYGTKVVVQTERGIELGEHVAPPCGYCEGELSPDQVACYVRNSGSEFCLPKAGRILRIANDQDVNEQRHLNAHVEEDIEQCAALAQRFGLDLKVVTAEHLLGGERIVFYFRSLARVDFRQLVKELAQQYRTRIEMRQVGARDEARLVADYETCGRECCCRNFLKKLRPVNMKMAKLQKSTLDPSKVSGRCGRLRCCLRYEHLGYEELAQRLPRVGSRVDTEFGPGTVLDRQILTQLVAVRTDTDHVMTIAVEEIRAFNLPPLPQPQPETPAAAETAQAEAIQRHTRGRRARVVAPPPKPAAGGPPAAAPAKPAPRAESRFTPEVALPELNGSAAPAAKGASTPDARTPTGEGQPGERRGRSRRRRRRRRPRTGGSPPQPSTGGAGG